MTAAFDSVAGDAMRWLFAAALDGTVFAALCWIASATLLRGAAARLMSLVWLAALLRFVVLGPLELHAVPLEAATLASPHIPSPYAGPTPWLAVAYAAVASALMFRWMLRQRLLLRDVTALSPAGPAIMDCVRVAAQQLALTRLPDVRVTQDDVPPFTAGTRNPTLVLPLWLCAPGARLHAVLLHELAHLERGDQHVIWLERLVTSLFFFWPPAHWVTHKLHEARELACDERAIECGAFAAPDYAEHLLDVVARTRGHAAHEALAIGRTAQRLERRIDRLLERARSHHPSARHAAVLLALLLTALVGFRPELPPPLAAAAPEPVFGDCAKLAAALANDTCNDGSCALQCGP